MDQFTLSVVIFYRRTLPASPKQGSPFDSTLVAEDWVSVAQPAGNPPPVNIGGGDITLTTPNDTQASYARPGYWLALCRADTSAAYPRAPNILKWYRIVTAASDSSNNLQMTLAGPDWIWGDTNHPTYACLFDGAVGCYERVIHLDGPSLWQ